MVQRHTCSRCNSLLILAWKSKTWQNAKSSIIATKNKIAMRWKQNQNYWTSWTTSPLIRTGKSELY